MSYKCEYCKTGQPPRTPQHTIVIDRRDVVEIANGEEIPTTQISKEMKVCPECHEKLTPKADPTKVVISQAEMRKMARAARKRGLLDDEEEEAT